MSSFIELKYIQLISSSLERFSWSVPNKTAGFRCNICGDSQKSKHKKRGCFYFVSKSDCYNFKCYNCGESMSLRKYLRLYFPHYYQEYRLESYGDSNKAHRTPEDAPKVDLSRLNKDTTTSPQTSQNHLLISLLDLPDDNPAVAYCISRKIPRSVFSKLYYTENYAEWVATFDEVDKNKKYPDDARLVMLMKLKDGTVIGAQGRALDNSALRYSTVKFDQDISKVFGLDTIRDSYPVFVLEGVIDSLFIPNSLAICGGDVGTSLEQSGISYDKFVFVLDNEPRNKDTIKRMEHAIQLGSKVCIWPVDSSLKDVNQMILAGMERNKILDIIMNNSFKGTTALLKLKQWKKT